MPRVLILGIGNLLWADEGFGERAVEALNRDYEFPANIRLMEGGTQGFYLSDYWQIPPGTPFAQLAVHWSCPVCDAPKDGFMVLEDRRD